MAADNLSAIFFSIILLRFFFFASAEPYIGLNYGEIADNLPPPKSTVNLLQSTIISKLRLYGMNDGIVTALAGTGIGIVIGTSNGEIYSFARNTEAATQWINTNILRFYPDSSITLITVGNEILTSGDGNLVNNLLPAMQNLQNALISANLGGKIKVSTVHSMAVLARSDPPSSGLFNSSFSNTMNGLLAFLKQNGSPFAINPYPFFAYENDPSPNTLAFCLFQPNPGRFDPSTQISYANMFDAQVDAVHSALNAAGYKDLEIVVAETGWPYRGDPNEVGANVENAKAYNGNLIKHLLSEVGTPLMPGKSVETYLFALYDEDLKPGPVSERYFGLFKPDLSMTYDVGLLKVTQASPVAGAGWCVAKVGVSGALLQGNLDYACGHGVDCSAIQPGGLCFSNDLSATASYAMNLYYQAMGRNPWNCDFRQTATLTYVDPSNGSCRFPKGTAGGDGGYACTRQ